MSAETRILPKRVTYATGINQTKTNIRPPNGSTGKNAPSHVSAAPGVAPATHAHVVSARDPAGAQRAAQQGQQIQRRPQDARVEILGPRGTAPAAGLQMTGAQATGIGNPFDHQQMLLIGNLLEQFAERTQAIGDVANTKLANDALSSLRRLHHATTAAAPRQAAQSPSAPFSVTTTILPRVAGPTGQARESAGPAAHGAPVVEIPADVSTRILDPREAQHSPHSQYSQHPYSAPGDSDSE